MCFTKKMKLLKIAFDWYSEQKYLPNLKPFVMATYGVASSYTLMMELAQLMGATLFKTNGWAQSSPYPVSPFPHQISFASNSLLSMTWSDILDNCYHVSLCNLKADWVNFLVWGTTCSLSFLGGFRFIVVTTSHYNLAFHDLVYHPWYSPLKYTTFLSVSCSLISCSAPRGNNFSRLSQMNTAMFSAELKLKNKIHLLFGWGGWHIFFNSE